MRVLITGAAGFIGSHLADRLAADGHAVSGIDNLLTGKLGNWAPGDTLHFGDITDRQVFYAFANDVAPDLVVHCAASYSDPDLWHRDIETNVAGTINAALVARYHAARLVYFQTALPPISSYAISKIAGEHYIRLAAVPALVFRLANIYGPRNLSGPIPTFFKRLSAGERCTVTQTSRDTVFIDDLVDLVTAAIDAEASGKFDVCSGQSYPILRYYRAVADALGIDDEPEIIGRPLDDVSDMELSPDAAETTFGWRATTPLAEGVARAVAWYREHGVAETYTHLNITKAA